MDYRTSCGAVSSQFWAFHDRFRRDSDRVQYTCYHVGSRPRKGGTGLRLAGLRAFTHVDETEAKTMITYLKDFDTTSNS